MVELTQQLATNLIDIGEAKQRGFITKTQEQHLLKPTISWEWHYLHPAPQSGYFSYLQMCMSRSFIMLHIEMMKHHSS